MKKRVLFILILITLAGFFGPTEIMAQNPPTGTVPNTAYQLLAPLTDEIDEDFDVSDTGAFSTYLNAMIKIFIGLCAVLAVVMIVIGGVEYMTSELLSSKEAGRERMTNAVVGLLIALGAYALLYTINPDLLSTSLDSLTQATITVEDLGGESTQPFVPISNSSLQALGISCPGSGGKGSVASIGQQFINKSTYSQTARNTTNSSTVFLDCSSFVAQVYKCAGLPNPGGTTLAMFSSGAHPVNEATMDVSKLNPGDLLGWMANPPTEKNGHVVIYLGNGQILDAQRNGAVQVRSLNSIKKRITHVKWFN